MEEDIFKNRLDTCLSGMTPAELILPRGGIRGPAEVLSSVGRVPALGCLGGGDGIGRNGLNTLKSTMKIPHTTLLGWRVSLEPAACGHL